MRSVIASVSAVVLCGAVVSAQDDSENRPGQGSGPRSHDISHPLGKKQRGQKQQALEARLAGRGAGRVQQIASGQYVELQQTRQDRIFVILAEFGNAINPVTGGSPGPLHNQIAEPDRSVDNATIWQADYNRAHYDDMYFSRMKDYYKKQSSGRYSFDGGVADWVLVPFNEARYGTNLCGASVCSTVWALVRDAINIWTSAQLASGKTLAQVQAELQTFDVWDRYDYNGNGNFDEPDGYIDHFQIVHAGEGEETGGGAQGANAIWSHRWYAFYTGIGITGPSFNKLGGAQFGTTGIWVGDYTMQPENGGLGVFAHEYGHDLGLPDNYDTTGASDNATGFWDLMSAGSYLGPGLEDIGSAPGDMTAWDKFQLGWLNYEVSVAGKYSSHRLGPAEATTKAAQGLFTILPIKPVTVVLGTPPEGSHAWWSGKGDNLDNTMIRSVTVPPAPSTLQMALSYDIELGWDYAYVAVSADNGATWTNLAGNVTTNTNPNGQNFGNGITGTTAGWVAATFDVSAFAGQNVLLALRYWTDGFVQGKGLLADQIVLGGFSDGAETSPGGWTLNGFRQTTGTETDFFNHYYLAEFRQYRDYDTGLRTGPYNFGFLNVRPDWVEHYPYQDGLLIHYWDTSQTDNDTFLHPGEGLILPIDAHPVPMIRADAPVPWSGRVQSHDATFGLQPTEPLTLHRNSVPSSYPSLPAAPVFNDLLDYWFPQAPYASVKVPKTGTTISVVNVNTQGNFMEVQVRPAK
jgi:immune inhibitor A